MREKPERKSMSSTGETYLSLSPGTYDFVARSSDGWIGMAHGIRIEAGEIQELEITLERGARLVLRYQGGPARALFRVRQGEGQVADGVLLRGASESVVVPAGALLVELDEGAGSIASRSVHTEPNGTAAAVFELD
jgi:hypothetical protein